MLNRAVLLLLVLLVVVIFVVGAVPQRASRPRSSPSRRPSSRSSRRPSRRPTRKTPTKKPTKRPTKRPTKKVTKRPTKKPTRKPTRKGTRRPTKRSTKKVTKKPTKRPTKRPTKKVTKKPTKRPTKRPTKKVTKRPTKKSTKRPTKKPTKKPTKRVTKNPTKRPTQKPTKKPTKAPTTTTYAPAPSPSEPKTTISPTSKPQKPSSVSTIEAMKYARSAYDGERSAAPPGYKETTYPKNRNTKFAVNDAKKSAIVGIKGTNPKDPRDLLNDIKQLKKPFDPKDKSWGNVARGYQNTYAKSVPPELKKQVEDLAKKGYSITISGHSLGGPVANLFAADIKRKYPNANINVVTIGSPPVGDKKFAAKYNSLGIPTKRIYSDRDPVPKTPFGTHVGDPVHLSSPKSEGLLKAHSINTYLNKYQE
jgi:hypothetical protein